MDLQIFNYAGKEIRTVQKDSEVWWVLKDVCDVLELSNPSMIADRLDEDEQMKVDPKQYLGSKSNEPVTVINESGLYNVILLSRKPEAKVFKRWVTHEVLPSIRKYGVYATAETAERLLNDPDFMIQTFQALKAEREKNKALENKIQEDKPKVLFADAVSVAKNSILVGDLAKLIKQNGYDIGAKRLFEWLRENGYLIRRKGTDYNMPTQKAMEMGLFEVKETAINNPDNSVRITKTTKVTGKGQIYFINKFVPAKEQTVLN